jgi:hypothetical protein
VKVVTEEDPIAREIARRTRAPSPAEDEVVEERALGETVSIWIDSKPAGLTVYWNGEMKFERPLIVPKGDSSGELKLKSPGYKEKTVTIVPDKEQTVTVRLKRLGKRKDR